MIAAVGRRLETPLEPLPSLFDLHGGSFRNALVAVATHVAGPLHPLGVESWDLALYGEGFEALSSDPFSFAGEFQYQGVKSVRVNLLGPAGFLVPPRWHGKDAGTEFHVTIEWDGADTNGHLGRGDLSGDRPCAG